MVQAGSEFTDEDFSQLGLLIVSTLRDCLKNLTEENNFLRKGLALGQVGKAQISEKNRSFCRSLGIKEEKIDLENLGQMLEDFFRNSSWKIFDEDMIDESPSSVLSIMYEDEEVKRAENEIKETDKKVEEILAEFPCLDAISPTLAREETNPYILHLTDIPPKPEARRRAENPNSDSQILPSTKKRKVDYSMPMQKKGKGQSKSRCFNCREREDTKPKIVANQSYVARTPNAANIVTRPRTAKCKFHEKHELFLKLRPLCMYPFCILSSRTNKGRVAECYEHTRASQTRQPRFIPPSTAGHPKSLTFSN